MRPTETAAYALKVQLEEVIHELDRLPLRPAERALLEQKVAHVGIAADRLVAAVRVELGR